MPPNHSDTLVVGAGQAAMAVARGLRELGYAGRVTLLGDETIPPYERPPLSKDFLTQVPSPAPMHFTGSDWWSAQDVDLVLGEQAVRIDPAAHLVHLASGATLGYGQLVIATGGRARQAVAGMTLRTVADALKLAERFAVARSVCVVGGGFLGLEIAASARSRGLEAVVLEAAPRLLSAVLPAELSEWLQALHVARGTRIHCGAVVTETRETEAGGFSVIADGLQVDADCLVTAIGMQPNTRLAEEAGLAVQGGIVVDALCRSSAADVYAIGDVAAVVDPVDGRSRRVESWQNADYQGALVAAAIAGAPIPARPLPWFWTEQYGLSIQVLGRLAAEGHLVWRGSRERSSFVAISMVDGRVAGAVGVNAGRELGPLRQLIAAKAEVHASVLAEAAGLRDVLAQVRRGN
ncbi:Anthranilate 1,2-dioxygenase system ferredoxin--NAD(+) reductase component [Xylophilus ampelinus]|nr:Anthranilate 1,2-dioxygenase system ferredoxin--NAD(+) reductase component [Xylophilus ampelinus]